MFFLRLPISFFNPLFLINNFLKPIVKIFLLKPLSGITSQMVDIKEKMKYSFKLNLEFIFLLIKSTKKKVKVAVHTLLLLICVFFFTGFISISDLGISKLFMM